MSRATNTTNAAKNRLGNVKRNVSKNVIGNIRSRDWRSKAGGSIPGVLRILTVNRLLESDGPGPKAPALRPIHGMNYFQLSMKQTQYTCNDQVERHNII